MSGRGELLELENVIPSCTNCPRLLAWCQKVANEKRAAYVGEEYWGRPVPGFGDSQAHLLVVGLAPGAHGANRTGRMFTGDRSGDWLYGALHRAGYANQPLSAHRNDGLKLEGAFVTGVVRCAPPGNRPTPDERDRCIPYLVEELRLLKNVRSIMALGSFAWDGVIRLLNGLGYEIKPKPKFGHGAIFHAGPFRVLGSYHPSQQNTFTKRLTQEMLDEVLAKA